MLRTSHMPHVPACHLQAVTAILAPHLNEPGLPPAVKFALKDDLKPSTLCGSGLETYTFTMHIPPSAGACLNLDTLCGGPSCVTALADKSYDNCPAFGSSGEPLSDCITFRKLAGSTASHGPA